MAEPNWKCPKCGSTHLRFMVSLIVAAPMDFYMNLSKKNIAKKELEIWGASWPTSDIYCMDCGYSIFYPKEKNAECVYESALMKIIQNVPDACAIAKEALELGRKNAEKRAKTYLETDDELTEDFYNTVSGSGG